MGKINSLGTDAGLHSYTTLKYVVTTIGIIIIIIFNLWLQAKQAPLQKKLKDITAFLCTKVLRDLNLKCTLPVANSLGRATLISCFIGGNSHPTIPCRFKPSSRTIGVLDMPPPTCSGPPAGSGQRQQALRGERLDVALRPGQPPDGVYHRGGEDQGREAQREQDQGGRDEEASQRGRGCSSGGGRLGSQRSSCSGLNTGK